MSQDFFRVEKGLEITQPDVDTGLQVISGSTAPGGDAGEQDDAPIGSLYLRSNGQLYTKTADTNATSDWQEKTSANLSSLSWRSELVRAATNDALTAGNTDPSSWTDNEGTIDHTDFAIGEYVYGDVDGTPALWEITGISAPNITLAAASDPLAANDTVVVQNYFPDSPAGQEGAAIITYDGTNAIKVADVDWNFADGIQMASGYAASSGDVSSSDTVNSAIEKLDGNNDAQDTTLGTAQGATNMGTFTGTIITDNVSVKVALQELETEVETKADQVTVDEIDQNVDDLITLSGVAENSTDLGSFTGTTIADNETVKGALQDLETALEAISGGETVTQTGVTTVTTIDEVVVDDFHACEWEVVAFEEAAPADKKYFKITGFHDGTAAADATSVKDKVNDKMNFGSFNLSTSIDLNGAGAAQRMRLRISSTSAGVTVIARRTCV